jgi:Ca2+-binding RTX toxin-like protein
MTGGAGDDRFYFSIAPNSSSNRDIVTDFKPSDDAVHLSKAVFAAISQGAGTLQSKFYWESSTGLAHDSDDRIIYETDTGYLRYDSNGSAAGGNIQVIAVLTNKAAIGTTLSNADFIIF